MIKFKNLYLKTHIKSIVRSNILLYKIRLLFKFNSNEDRLFPPKDSKIYHLGLSLKFPSKKTKLYIDGFQRSANTYCRQLLIRCFPDLNLAWNHFHTLAPLKLAIKHNVPIIIIIRNPQGAVFSSIIRKVYGSGSKKKITIENDSYEYFKYYNFVLNNLEKITVLNFDDYTKNPVILTKTVSDLLNEPEPEYSLVGKISDEVLLMLRDDKRENPAMHQLNSEKKDAMKANLKSEILKNFYYSKCEKVYDSILKKINNQNNDVQK